jgi:hypothetical protein
MKINRIIIGYGVLSAFAIALGLYDFIYFHDVATEHLLPAALLFFVGFPSSLSLLPLFIIFPVFFHSVLVQYIWLNACVFFQLALLHKALRTQEVMASPSSGTLDVE